MNDFDDPLLLLEINFEDNILERSKNTFNNILDPMKLSEQQK